MQITAKIPHTFSGLGALEARLASFSSRGDSAILCIAPSQAKLGWIEKIQAANPRVTFHVLEISGEPSPEAVDAQLRRLQALDVRFDFLIALGGGSVLDFSKALAGLVLIPEASVMDYLEGVGRGLSYPGPCLPWVAIPTTAGTGSEVTKNAVLSRQGAFKKSFRDDRLLADEVILDGRLLMTCPDAVLAACGMDALTQLIEAYVSPRKTALTSALMLDALPEAFEAMQAFAQGGWTQEHAQHLLYGAYVSGIALANCGLGAVHGLAAPMGAHTTAPHGLVCAHLLVAVTRANIHALKTRGSEIEKSALADYEALAIVCGFDRLEAWLETLDALGRSLPMDSLANFGLTKALVPKLVAESGGNSMKTNPIHLTPEELTEILQAQLA
jgi:alcohol dehydrogenase